MRQQFTIILTVIVIIAVLVLLNSVAGLKQEKTQDFEVAPNRSTYHSGPTGVRALHDFLSESGYKVIRWRDTPRRLLGESGKLVTTFVVVGQTQIPFGDDDRKSLHEWVADGGRLIIIDRRLNDLAPVSEGWRISSSTLEMPNIDTDPANSKQMIDTVTAFEPVQPTILTSSIQSILPSRFAARLKIIAPTEYASSQDKPQAPKKQGSGEPPAPLLAAVMTPVSPAPIVHIGDRYGAVLVDYSYGLGRVVILTDPFIVSNGGIRMNDNLQLAVNAITGREGVIAFDEYHQGRGVTQNALAAYFSGTPVLALAGQLVLLVLVVLWTRSRRFGRPLPLPQVDRRSTLEFVASMAELQQRSRAFDLAIENIYTRTRRVLTRYAGLDYNSPRTEIAARIAARSSIDGHKLETLMRQCEEAINGAEISSRQSIDLVRRLREVEKELGLFMRQRDARQAAEKI